MPPEPDSPDAARGRAIGSRWRPALAPRAASALLTGAGTHAPVQRWDPPSSPRVAGGLALHAVARELAVTLAAHLPARGDALDAPVAARLRSSGLAFEALRTPPRRSRLVDHRVTPIAAPAARVVRPLPVDGDS